MRSVCALSVRVSGFRSGTVMKYVCCNYNAFISPEENVFPCFGAALSSVGILLLLCDYLIVFNE